MKKIYSLCLIVTVFLIPYAIAQTHSSGYGQLGVHLNKSLPDKSRSTDSCQTVLDPKKGEITSEKSVPNQESNISVRPDSKLDSLVLQMLQQTISEMSEQARISAENSIREFIKNNSAQSVGIPNALIAPKSGKASF